MKTRTKDYSELITSSHETDFGEMKISLFYRPDVKNKYLMEVYDSSLEEKYNPLRYYAESFADLLNIQLDWPYGYQLLRQYYPLDKMIEEILAKPGLIKEWEAKTIMKRWVDLSKQKIPGWEIYCFSGVKKVFVSDEINIYSCLENHSFPPDVRRGFFADIDESFLIFMPNLESLVKTLILDFSGKISEKTDLTILQIVKRFLDHSLLVFWHW